MMVIGPLYRGGASLRPRADEVKIDRLSGLLKPTRGVSVYDRSDHPNLAKHCGAHLLGSLPSGLKAIQAGRDPSHHEIVPDAAMSFEEFAGLLDRISLTPE